MWNAAAYITINNGHGKNAEDDVSTGGLRSNVRLRHDGNFSDVCQGSAAITINNSLQRLGVIFPLVTAVENLVCMRRPLSPLNKGHKSTLEEEYKTIKHVSVVRRRGGSKGLLPHKVKLPYSFLHLKNTGDTIL